MGQIRQKKNLFYCLGNSRTMIRVIIIGGEPATGKMEIVKRVKKKSRCKKQNKNLFSQVIDDTFLEQI